MVTDPLYGNVRASSKSTCASMRDGVVKAETDEPLRGRSLERVSRQMFLSHGSLIRYEDTYRLSSSHRSPHQTFRRSSRPPTALCEQNMNGETAEQRLTAALRSSTTRTQSLSRSILSRIVSISSSSLLRIVVSLATLENAYTSTYRLMRCSNVPLKPSFSCAKSSTRSSRRSMPDMLRAL